MSTFDPNAFLDAVVTASNDTKVIPVPVGEYVGIVEKVTPRQWQSKDGTKTGIALDLLWSIEDGAVKEYLGRDNVTCKQGIMLDLNEDGSGLDTSTGKNITLGRLREAVGMNQPGQRFSFAQLQGQMAKVKVTHRISDDGQDTYSEIKSVAKA